MDETPAPQPTETIPQTASPLSPSDERTWAMFAHLSILVNLISGFLGLLAALIIYLVYKDRSRYVAYHSLQSLFFQLVFWVGGGVIVGVAWALTGVLSAILVGLLCIPLAGLISLIPIAALVYGIVGAVQTSQGRDFRYWLVGDWVRETLSAE